ncbi:hypothetical protein [Vulgatibacter sp.]|uniref:hypothetical protein n=1 Tax=Vulgatibacter sp. TaxID=1971226 RepID=UPI00356282B9
MLARTLALLAVLVPLAAHGDPPGDRPGGPDPLGPFSLRVGLGGGFSDLGVAGRAALEGEAWLDSRWGLGGTLAASAAGETTWNEPGLTAYNFRSAFLAIPEGVLALGTERSRFLLRGGLGLARYEWYQVGCEVAACPSVPAGGFDGVASVAGGYLLTPAPLALSFQLRGERLLSSGGWATTLDVAVGWSGP